MGYTQRVPAVSLRRPLRRFPNGTCWSRNETRMQYTYVEIVTVKPGQMDDTLRKAETELLPLYRQSPGFVAYTIAKTDEVSATALSIWETREQAEHALEVRESWMKEGTARSIDSFHNAIGSLPFLAFTNKLIGYTSAIPTAAGRHA